MKYTTHATPTMSNKHNNSLCENKQIFKINNSKYDGAGCFLRTSLTFGDVPQLHFPVCTTSSHNTIDGTALYRVHFTLVRVLKQKKDILKILQKKTECEDNFKLSFKLLIFISIEVHQLL